MRATCDAPLIAVAGDADHGSCDRLMESLDIAFACPESTDILFDLSECTDYDGAVVHVLWSALDRLHSGAHLSLIAPSKDLLRLLSIVGLDSESRLMVFASRDEALHA